MKQRKHLLFLCIFCLCAICCVLTACFGPADPSEPPAHVHTYDASHTCQDCNDTLTLATGLSFTLRADGTSYALSGIGNETKTGFLVPDTYQGKPVVAVAEGAFDQNKTLEAVVLPNSITAIEARAFADCTALRYLILPNALETVGTEAILRHADLQTNAYENALYLGSEENPYLYLWKGKNASISKCNIHTSAKFVGTGAFDACSSLSSVTVPDGILSIENGALGKAKHVTLPAHVVTALSGARRYGDTVLAGSAHLESVTVKGNSLPAYAFYQCTNLRTVTLQDVETVGDFAFAGCGMLTEIHLGNRLHTIGANAFAQCKRLTAIPFPQSLKEIGANAFIDCEYLMEISLPSGLQRVGSGAFDSVNPSIFSSYGEAYYLGNDTNPHLLLVKAKNNQITSCTIHSETRLVCPSAFSYCYHLTTNSYQNAAYVGSAENRYFVLVKAASASITDCTTHPETRVIGDAAFEHCTDLSSLSVSAKVTAIGARLCYRCTSLSSITVDSDNPVFSSNGNCLIETAKRTLVLGCAASQIPTDGSVTAIGDYAFAACDALTSFAIPNGILSIGDHAFEDCTQLKSVTLPSTLCEIGQDAFRRSGLQSISIPQSTRSIGSGAFAGCSALQTVTADSANPVYLAKGNSLIDREAKALLVGTKTSQIPTDGSVTAIGAHAFSGRSGLQTAAIPASVTAIGEYAFANCTDLRSVTIADSVALIGSNAFYGCELLKSVTLPQSLQAIDSYLFGSCESLEEIYIPKTVHVIRGYAFFGCANLRTIRFGGSESEWAEMIFNSGWDMGTGIYTVICEP